MIFPDIPEFRTNNSGDYEKLLWIVTEPMLSLKDAGVSSKVFNDWRKAGFWFGEPEGKRTWARLNLEEYVWLKMIQQMRVLGSPTDLISKVKQQLFATISLEEGLSQYKSQILEQIEKMPVDKDQKEILRRSMSDDQFIQELSSVENGMHLVTPSILRSLLFSALVRHQHVAILVYPNGNMIPWIDEIHQMAPDAQKLFKVTHIYLSINEHLMEFLTDPEKESFISSLQLLNHEEIQVLRSLRDKTLKEIKISFNKGSKSKKPSTLLVITKNGEVAADDNEAIVDLLMNKKYTGITLKKRSGGMLYFEREVQQEI